MSKSVEALREIAAMTFDPWTNGAKAGEIARAALAEHDPPMMKTLADAYDAVQQERTEREPLSDEQIMALDEYLTLVGRPDPETLAFARAIEAAHGIK